MDPGLVFLSLALLMLVLMAHVLEADSLIKRLLPPAAVALISIYLHLPNTQPLLNNFGFKYSDLIYGVYHPRFSYDLLSNYDELTKFWFNPNAYLSLVYGNFTCPLPYIDYAFEYPPVIALLWIISTCAGFRLSIPKDSTLIPYPTIYNNALITHYLLQSLFLTTAFVLSYVYLGKILTLLGKSPKRVLIYVLLPSTIIFLAYNWDVIAALLSIVGFYLFLRRKYTLSGMFLGLSVSTKVLTIGLTLWLGFELLNRVLRGEETLKNLIGYLVTAASTALLPFMMVYLIAPQGFLRFIEHHTSWYCENCLYMIFVHDISSPNHRIFYAVFTLSIFIVLIVFRLIIGKPSQSSLLNFAFTSLTTPILFNYVFSPQMFLMITPFSLITLDKVNLMLYVISDLANSGVILTFFIDETLRAYLSRYIPLPVKYDPWSIDSPTQWLATARNLILLWIVVVVFFQISKEVFSRRFER